MTVVTDLCALYFKNIIFSLQKKTICAIIKKMFVFVRDIMKSNLPAKIFIAVCLCLVTALTFTACKDKEIYAESSDFESYPDYWNDFNEDNGELYVPDNDDISGSSGSSSEEDWTANFIDDEEEDIDKVDTDGDGNPNQSDPDIDGDGTENKDDPDVDGDGVENEKDPDIDGDDIPNEGDTDEDGTVGNDSGVNEGPFVPLN